jgi:hypothetical protein
VDYTVGSAASTRLLASNAVGSTHRGRSVVASVGGTVCHAGVPSPTSAASSMKGTEVPKSRGGRVGVRAGVCVETRGDLKSHSSDCAATFSACVWRLRVVARPENSSRRSCAALLGRESHPCAVDTEQIQATVRVADEVAEPVAVLRKHVESSRAVRHGVGSPISP